MIKTEMDVGQSCLHERKLKQILIQKSTHKPKEQNISLNKILKNAPRSIFINMSMMCFKMQHILPHITLTRFPTNNRNYKWYMTSKAAP